MVVQPPTHTYQLLFPYTTRDIDWAASNYPRARTSTAEWLHKVIDRSVSQLVVYVYIIILCIL